MDNRQKSRFAYRMFTGTGTASSPARSQEPASAQSFLSEDIEEREISVEAHIRLYNESSRGRNPEHLREAISNLQEILRHLPRDSPQRPQYLHRISYVRLSEYEAYVSKYLIDDAVRYGRLAKEEATTAGLKLESPMLYRNILNNLGVALSYRCHDLVILETNPSRTQRIADLDESIQCAREMRTFDSNIDPLQQQTLLNLVSRLEQRYSILGHDSDHSEAVSLLQEAKPTTPQESAMVVIQKVLMAGNRFYKTRREEDLEETLNLALEGLEKMPKEFQGRNICINSLSEMYAHRFDRTNNIADIRNAIHYSDMKLGTVHPFHRTPHNYISAHLRLLQDMAQATTSLDDIRDAVNDGQRRIKGLVVGTDEWLLSCRRYGNILGRKYILSQSLEDLSQALSHVLKMCDDRNHQSSKSGAYPRITTLQTENLIASLGTINSAPSGHLKDSVAKRLYEQVKSACKSQEFFDVQMNFSDGFIALHGVYADALKAGELITEDHAHEKVKQLQLEEKNRLEQDRKTSRWKQGDWEAIMGKRELAIDPTTGQIVLELSGIMSNLFGFNISKPMSPAEFKANCDRLEKESIEKARLAGRHPNPKLCHMCRTIKPLQPTDESSESSQQRSFQWNRKMSLPFGNWNQLNLRRWCAICKLILSLITTNQNGNTLHPRLASIDPEIQGTRLSVGQLATGEEVLMVDYGMRPVGQLRIVSSNNRSHAIQQWSEKLGQRSDTSKDGINRHIHVATLKQWLADCDQGHEKLVARRRAVDVRRGTYDCNYRGLERARFVADFPLVLIDVVDSCLVSRSTGSTYIALSYVWGNAKMEQTLLKNYQHRCQVGGLSSTLPNTISDAIALVRLLGERYLWVDSLCIIQDDTEHKARNISNMDVVYSKAYATIIALHGSNADAGLPGVGSRARQPQLVETLVVDSKSGELDCDPNNSDQVTLRLAATPPPLHLVLEDSVWDTRGWTFQERLLSRRCIYFSERYMYFDCGRRDTILSEGGANSSIIPKHFTDEHEQDLLTTQLDNPITDLWVKITNMGLLEKNVELAAHRVKTFDAYGQLVAKYSIRQLSHDSDIINAFLGTFAALNRFFQSDIFCGLPASVLDLALLWTPAERTFRRGMAEFKPGGRSIHNRLLPTNRGTVLGVFGPTEVQTFDDKIDRKFPSWSWVGWKGAVDFRLTSDALPEEPLPKPLIREAFINHDGKDLQSIKLDGSIQPAVDPASDTLPLPKPLLPNVLQFLAPCVPLTAFTITTDYKYISHKDHIHAPTNQAVRRILDSRGQHCGLWWEQAGYVYIGRGVSPKAESRMLLVGISRHEDTYKRRSGPGCVEGSMQLFEEDSFSAVGKGSGLVNVLVVDLDMGHDYGERVTVAKIHATAWEAAGPVTKMVRLA